MSRLRIDPLTLYNWKKEFGNLKIGPLCISVVCCTPITTGQLTHRTQRETNGVTCLLISVSLWLSILFAFVLLLWGLVTLFIQYPNSSTYYCEDATNTSCDTGRDEYILYFAILLLGSAVGTILMISFMIGKLSIKANDDVRRKYNLVAEFPKKNPRYRYICCYWFQYQAFVQEGVCDDTYELCSPVAIRKGCEDELNV